MRIVYLILVILFSFFIVTFSQENLTRIHLQYYKYLNIDVPTYMLIFASLLVGVIITAFWGVVERFRLNRTIRRLNKLVRDLRRELHAHEAPPMIDEQNNQNSNGFYPEKLRFLTDASLARLAKWLRLLGYDTAVFPKEAGRAMLRRADAEARIVLTRRRDMIERLVFRYPFLNHRYYCR